MSVKKYRTEEEKQALIKAFLASGKTMSIWCKEINVATSTFTRWMKPSVYEETKEVTHFIPLKQKIGDNTPSALIDSSSLILEIGSCNIHVTPCISMPFLAEVLKVVKSSHV